MKIAYLYENGRLERLGAVDAQANAPFQKYDLTDEPLESGASDFFYGAVELVPSGHEVTLIEPGSPERLPAVLKWLRDLFGERILPARLTWHDISRVKTLSRELGAYDAVVITNDTLAFAVLFWNRLLRRRQRIVGIFCKLLTDPLTAARRRKTRAYLKGLKVMLFGAGEKSGLIDEFGLKESEVHVNDFGVDHHFWQPAQKENSGEAGDRILSIGNDGLRDFNLLVQAAGAVDCPIEIITSRDLGQALPPNVHWIRGSWHQQRLTDEDLREYYQRCSLVVIPVRKTFQPSGQSVALQAMACGKAVLMSRIEGLWDKEHLKEGENILFYEPEDQQSLEVAIQRALSRPEQLQTIGKESRKYVEAHGAMKYFAGRIEKLLTEVTL